MSHKYWLLIGLLAFGTAQTVACSSAFHSCQERRNCTPSGTSGKGGAAGDAGAGTDGGEAGANEGGTGGRPAQAGSAGNADDAGTGGMAGDAGVVDTELTIAQPTLPVGKTYVPFTAKLSASGAAQYTWNITSGTLPAGLTLQGAQSATATIAGTPTEAGQFALTLSVTDGSITKTADVTLAVTHSALFLSDRNVAGVNELFIAEIGASPAAAPVRLSASLPSGGSVSSYAWSPDGSKVLYLASQSAGGAAELWVASLASPGIAQRVSAPGVSVSKTGWLLAGGIAAYLNSNGDAYLVDLSGSAPGASKLVVSGPSDPGELTPSPNGTSLVVSTSKYDDSSHFHLVTLNYVTWGTTEPKSVVLIKDDVSEQRLHFSYDGRFGVATNIGTTRWWDLSLPSPMAAGFTNDNSGIFSFSPIEQAIVFINYIPEPTPPARLALGTFKGGTLTSTALIPQGSCTTATETLTWSPNGKNVLFRCNNDLRGISNVATTSVGTDFSVLPNGFWSNAFTSIPNVDWSSDAKWIAIRADRDLKAQYDLYLLRWSAPGVAYKPHANSTASGVTTWRFAPNSQSVAFVGTIAPQSNAGLYLTTLPATGAPPIASLISAPATAVVQTDVNWLPGSRVITYRATVAGAAQLFAVPVAADGTAGSALPISGVSGRGVTSYQLAPTR